MVVAAVAFVVVAVLVTVVAAVAVVIHGFPILHTTLRTQ